MKKANLIKLIVTLIVILVNGYLPLKAQNTVGIGTTNPNQNAVLELYSPTNDQGLLVPRITSGQRTSLTFTSNENGLLVFDIDLGKFFYWYEGSWFPLINMVSGPAAGDLTGTYPNPQLADGVVATVKLADGSVTAVKIADGEINTIKLADGAVNSAKLAANAIDSTHIKTSSIARTDLSDNIINSTKILDGTIQTSDLASQSVTIDKINSGGLLDKVLSTDAAGSPVWEDKSAVLAGALGRGLQLDPSNQIEVNPGSGLNFDGLEVVVDADNLTIGADLANGVFVMDDGITLSKIAHGAGDEILTTDISGVPQWETKGAIIGAIAGNGLAWDAANSEIDADLDGSTLGLNGTDQIEVVDGGITSAKIADGGVQTIDIAADAIDNTKVADNAIQTENIVDGQVQNLDLGTDAVTSDKVMDGTIQSADILDGTIVNSDLADNSITTVKILDGEVQTNDIADANITTTKIADDNVTLAKIADGPNDAFLTTDPAGIPQWETKAAIHAALAGNGLVWDAANGEIDVDVDGFTLGMNGTDQIEVIDGGITSIKIADGNVQNIDIAADAIDNTKVADNAIQTENIVDGQVQNNDLAADAVTSDKITNGTIANADINAAAAIEGTKINPDFGAQNVTTTGDINSNSLQTSGGATLNSASIINDASVGGNLTVTGSSTLTGNTSLGGTLTLPAGNSVNEITTIVDGAATNSQLPTAAAVNTANAAIQAELDATQAGAGLNADGTYTANGTANYIAGATDLQNADDLLDAQMKTNADANTTLQNEVDAIESGSGLNTDGTYAGNVGTNYIDAATDLNNADILLDNQVGTNATDIAAETTNRTNADAAMQTELDATQTGAGLNTDGTYTANGTANFIAAATDLQNADDLLDAQIQTNTDANTAIQTEVDAIETGSGLNTDGTYAGNVGTNYIDAATDLNNADVLLDNQLGTNAADIAAETTNRTNADAAIQTEMDATQSGAGLNADGTYTANGAANYISAATDLQNADDLLDAQVQTNAAANTNLQTEVDAIETGAGLNTDGTYTANSGANYINIANNLNNADLILDIQVRANEADIATETTSRTNADAAIQTEMDATQSGAGLNADGTYTANGAANYIAGATNLQNADNLLDVQLKTNADANMTMQSEINAIETGAGLNADGTYNANLGTNYISAATSLNDADVTLDGQVNTNATDIATETTNRTNADAAIQSELDDTQTGAGLNADGTYTANGTANFIAGATDLQNADDLLDAQVKLNTDKLDGTSPINSIDINSGTIDGTIIGATTPAAGTFTTLTGTTITDGTFSVNGGTISAGTWNGSTIAPTYGGLGIDASAFNGFIKGDGMGGFSASAINLAGTDVTGTLAIANGGTGATTATNARTNLGLTIGADVQAYDAGLLSIAGLGAAANKFLYTTGVDAYAEADITAAGLAILDDADAATQRTTLGLGNVENTALSSWTGTTNITTLGTIAAGTWNGTTIGAGYGGTGVDASAATNGQLLIGNGAGFSLANIAGTANQITVTNGAGTISLSTPQDIDAAATPTFGGMTLNGALGMGINNITSSGTISGGTVTDGTFSVTGGNLTTTGTLNADGAVNLGAPTIATSVEGTLTVAELSTFNGNVDINGGSIDNTIIGATTAAAGTFTSLTVTNLGDADGQTFNDDGGGTATSLTIDATGLFSTSDRRYKTNITSIDSALIKILKVAGVQYNFKNDTTKLHTGVIAQEIEKLFPHLVRTDENGYKSVNYIEIIPILMEAMKEQQAMINALQTKVDQHEEDIATLTATVAEQQAQNESINNDLQAIKAHLGLNVEANNK